MSDPKLWPKSHQQNDATGTTSVNQESPKVNQLKMDGTNNDQKEYQQVRNTAQVAFGRNEVKKDVSQHRAADKFDDYSFKNLALGNMDHINTFASTNKYNDFVRTGSSSSDRTGTQTPGKTAVGKQAIIDKNQGRSDQSADTSSKYNSNIPVEQEMGLVNRRSDDIQTKTSQFFGKSFSNSNLRMLGHAGLTAAVFLASLKMHRGVIPSLKASAVAGVVGGLVINPEPFNPYSKEFMFSRYP